MTKLITVFRNFGNASKNQKEQNTSQNNTLHFNEESEFKWKFFYNNNRTASTAQEITTFPLQTAIG
jgi:hypothetical protein